MPCIKFRARKVSVVFSLFLFLSTMNATLAAPATNVATPVPSAATAMKAAVIFANKSISNGRINKLLNSSTAAYFHIAPSRHQSIVLNGCAGLKHQQIKKFIKGQKPKHNAENFVSENADYRGPQFKIIRDKAFTIVTTEELTLRPVSYSSPEKEQDVESQTRQNSISLLSNNEAANQHFEEGEAIFIAQKDTKLRIANHDLKIASGTIVLLKKAEGCTCVINLCDTKRDAICLESGCKKTFLRPGEECVIGDCSDTIRNFRKGDGLGRRFAKTSTNSKKEMMSFAEISIPALLKQDPALAELIASDEKQDRKHIKRMLKMAACIAYSGRPLTPFQLDE